MSNMDLSIIIISWKVKEELKENLSALFKSAGRVNFEVFVVDNDSKDGTAEMVKSEFPRANLIANNYNAGFARANNQALRLCSGQARYVLLLNPDMRVLPGTLEEMIKWMDGHPEAGAAGCHLVCPVKSREACLAGGQAGAEQFNVIGENNMTVPHVRRFPTVLDQLAIVLKLPHLFPKILDDYLLRDFDYNKEAEVDSIRGSFFMIRREVIEKLGGLDERYFIWFEEVDYCRQIKNAGRKVMYAPAVKCVDYVGKSFAQVKRGKAQKYFRDSMLKYFKKWHPIWQYWILRIAWPIGMFIAWAGERLNFKSEIKT